MKILILAVNPRKTEPLRLDEEIREIQLCLERSEFRDQFEVITQLAVRTEDLRRALLKSKPQIVHFCGHGTGQQGLLFENEKGEAKYVSNESLSRLFKLFANQIKCVLLNACYSEVQATAIHQYIDYVIGMNQAIGDRAAIEFSVGFYEALGAGKLIEDAFEFGLSAIELEGIPESSTPKILVKDSEGSPRENPQIQEELGKKQYVLVLTAKLNEVNEAEAEAIVAHLRQLLGDENLKLTKRVSGSVVLLLEGDEEGLRKLETLLASGQLTELLNKPIKDVSELRFYLINQLANKIAQAYLTEDSDINEFGKAAAYFRRIVHEPDAKERFFRYLKTLIDHGNKIGHSKMTVGYYWNMNEVCSKYLKNEQIDAYLMLEIIGWATRLMRYYKVAPIGETTKFETNDMENAAVIEREAAIEALKSTQSFQEGQLIEAQVDKKQPKGTKVTYLIAGIPFTEKEPKTFSQIPDSGVVKVQIKSLKEDGSINHVKFVEP